MFEGPIFIVGRPRSGSKLLRRLLTQHSCISISPVESTVIPYYAAKAKTLGDLHDAKNLAALVDGLSKATFYRDMDHLVDKNLWLSSITDFSYPGVINALFKAYASSEGKNIWGDKSPSYMLHMPLLKEMFPDAKFLHLIRDVRDVCLSLITTWGLHPLRGAQQWHDDIMKCREDAHRYLSEDYLEIQYETLLQNPRSALMRICAFLGLNFEEAMTQLERPVVSKLDSARGVARIVSSNMEKWRDQLSPHLVEKIEGISFDLLQELGYPVIYAQSQTRLTSTQLLFFKGIDTWNWFKFDTRLKGSIMGGLIRQYRRIGLHAFHERSRFG